MAGITSVGENCMCVWECGGVGLGGQPWRRYGPGPTAAAPTIGSATHAICCELGSPPATPHPAPLCFSWMSHDWSFFPLKFFGGLFFSFLKNAFGFPPALGKVVPLM